jgi:hypothetical protein
MTLNSELVTALIFLVFGAVAFIMGWGYGFGTPAALGSGAMPMLAGGGLCLLGLVQLLRTSAAQRAGERLLSAFPRSEMRPLLIILAAVLAFGLLIEPLGLIPSLTALVAIAWFAEAGGRKREMLAVLAVVIVLIVGIFYFGLGIPFRLVGGWRL